MALNKSARPVINRKYVFTSQNEGFVEKYDFTGPKNCFHLNQCLKKLKKTASTSRNKIFINIDLPLIAIMVSNKL